MFSFTEHIYIYNVKPHLSKPIFDNNSESA